MPDLQERARYYQLPRKKKHGLTIYPTRTVINKPDANVREQLFCQCIMSRKFKVGMFKPL